MKNGAKIHGASIASPVTLRIAQDESSLFCVRRIYCVGRNYLDHIREMGGDERDPPFFFQKPTDSLVESGSEVPYPSITADFQHEVELVIAIGREGSDIPVADAYKYVFGLNAVLHGT